MTELEFNVITPYNCTPVIESLSTKSQSISKEHKRVNSKFSLPKGSLPIKDLERIVSMLIKHEVLSPTIDPLLLTLAKWFRSNHEKSLAVFMVSLEDNFSRVTKTHVKELLAYKRHFAMEKRDMQKERKKVIKSTKTNHDTIH